MQQLCEIEKWIDSLINGKKISIPGAWGVQKIASDASSRCYYRLVLVEPSLPASYIIAASPVGVIDNTPFIEIASDWKQQGVNVPTVYHFDKQRGFMLLEDLGSVHLLDQLKKRQCSDYYRQSIEQLIVIQQIAPTGLAPFDREFLLREMKLFATWLIEYQLQLEVPPSLDKVYEVLISNALSQPQVTMHRDFHSRNLLLNEDKIAVIDFQDAVKGPLAYDLVSLLRDCYFSLSDAEIEQLIDCYLQQLENANLFAESVDRSEFVRWFDLIGLQRHLKVLGLFIRLGVQAGKSGYLKDMHRVFDYVVYVSGKYPQLNEFHQWLSTDVAEQLAKQSWYRS